MHRSDGEIIAAVRAGRTHCFAELIDRYKDRAFALAMRMLRDPRDAEEAAQDAFLRAFRALETFRGDAAFGTWFYRILYNGCLSRSRKMVRTMVEIDIDGVTPSGVASPAELLERGDLARQVTAAIDRLSPNYATVLSLFYLQELSLEEICAVTDQAVGNVKVQLHRARLSLIRELQRESIYDEVAA